MELEDLLDQVHDRDSFLIFVQALLADRLDEVARERAHPSNPYGPGANGWETGSIEQFLEHALAWAQDTLDRPGIHGLPVAPAWHDFARFLFAGKVYE